MGKMKNWLLIILCILFLAIPSSAADVKVTQLPEDTAPTSDDLAIIVDSPEGTPVTKKATLANITKAFGWIDSSAYTTIELANIAAYDAGKLLVVAKNHTLTANTTLTAKVKVLPGGSFTKASTYTLTINGPFESSLYQVFFGFDAGDVTFGPGTVKEVPPYWWVTNTTPGTTDMSTALACATASQAPIVRLLGINAIGSTWELRTATSYFGPQSGSYIIGQTHPSSGYGAALKWIGAASGTMVKVFNCLGVVWDGIDLDGVDYTDDVTGFRIYSDNNPITTLSSFTNFQGFNLGTGAYIGDPDYQTDNIKIERFKFYMVNKGIRINSDNALQHSTISQGYISCYTHGIHIERGGSLLEIDRVGFSGMQNCPATGAYIYIEHGGHSLRISTIQGEEAVFTGWKDIRFADYGVQLGTPVTILNSVINRGIITTGSGRKIISIGNTYNVGAACVTLTGSDAFTSIGDFYQTAADVISETGANVVTLISPLYTGGATGTEILKTMYGGVEYFKVTYVGITTIGGGTPIIKFLAGTISIDPGSIASTSRGAITWTLTGAAAGDRVIMHPPADLNDDLIFVGSKVTGTNEVTVYLYNPTGGAIDDTAKTWEWEWFNL